MIKSVSIRTAYESKKRTLSEARQKIVEQNILTFSKLLENTEKIKEIATELDKLEEMAELSSKRFPFLASFVNENIQNFMISSTKLSGTDLFQESYYNLLAVTEFMKQLPAMSDGSEDGLYESFKGCVAASLVENVEPFKELAKEFVGASAGQQRAFAMNAPRLPLVVSEGVVKKVISELNEDYYDNDLGIKNSNLNGLVSSLKTLSAIVARLGPEFKETQAGLKKFEGRFRNAAAGGLAGLTVDNQKRLIGQAEVVITMFKKLGDIWPSVKRLFGNDLEDVTDIQQYEKVLKQFQATLRKELGGGILAGLNRLFGKNLATFPAEINPDIVLKDIMEVLRAPGPDEKELGPQQPRSIRTTGAVAETKTSFKSILTLFEDLAKLDQIMTALASSAPTAPKPEETAKMAATVAPKAKDPENADKATPAAAGGTATKVSAVQPASSDSNPVVAAIENVKSSNLPPEKKKQLVAAAVEKAMSGDVKAAFADLMKELEKAAKPAASAGPATPASVTSPSTPSSAPAAATTTAPTTPTKAPRKRVAAKPATTA
jgi:hypothetical protein